MDVVHSLPRGGGSGGAGSGERGGGSGEGGVRATGRGLALSRGISHLARKLIDLWGQRSRVVFIRIFDCLVEVCLLSPIQGPIAQVTVVMRVHFFV